jgi:hypothetical protein
VIKNGQIEFVSEDEFEREERIQDAMRELDLGQSPRPKHTNAPVEDVENLTGPSLMVEVDVADSEVDEQGELKPRRRGAYSSVFDQSGATDAVAPVVLKSSEPGTSVIRGERRPAR